MDKVHLVKYTYNGISTTTSGTIDELLTACNTLAAKGLKKMAEALRAKVLKLKK